MDAETSGIPHLTEADIRGWVGETSFARSVSYARSDAVFDTPRYGQTLKGQCQGTLPSPYQIRVDFSPRPVSGAGEIERLA